MCLNCLTIKEIREKKLKKYYKVVLLNDCYDVCACLGRFEFENEACIKASDYVDIYDVGEDFVQIHRYCYDFEKDIYRLECRYKKFN